MEEDSFARDMTKRSLVFFLLMALAAAKRDRPSLTDCRQVLRDFNW